MRAFSLAAGKVSVESGPGTDEPTTRERALLVGLVVVYAEVLVALALLGRFTFVCESAIVPALVVAALLVRRFAAFVEDWAVFLASVILFDTLRGLVYTLTVRLDLPVHAAYPARAG